MLPQRCVGQQPDLPQADAWPLQCIPVGRTSKPSLTLVSSIWSHRASSFAHVEDQLTWISPAAFCLVLLILTTLRVCLVMPSSVGSKELTRSGSLNRHGNCTVAQGPTRY